MPHTIQIAVDILLALLTGGILLFFLEIMHIEGSVSKEFKEVMNPFYHKLSKYLIVLNYYRYHLIAKSDDVQGKNFIKQLESISRYGLEAVVSGRDISYLSAQDLDNLCNDINNKIWYTLDRDRVLMNNLSVKDTYDKSEVIEALNEVFPNYKEHPIDVPLLYDSSGKFYNKIWEPVQHCTGNYEYFQEEEKKARELVLAGLTTTLLSLLAIMVWVDIFPTWIPSSLAILSSLILAVSLRQLSYVSSVSKQIVRSTRDEINGRHKRISNILERIKKCRFSLYTSKRK